MMAGLPAHQGPTLPFQEAEARPDQTALVLQAEQQIQQLHIQAPEAEEDLAAGLRVYPLAAAMLARLAALTILHRWLEEPEIQDLEQGPAEAM